MKKQLIIGLLSVLVLSAVHGQQAGKISLGFCAGIQFGMHETQDGIKNWLRANSMSESSVPGFNLSIYGLYSFTDYIALQTELNVTLGVGIKGKYDNSHWANATYACLDIPILLKVNFLKSREKRFGILGGPYFNTPLGQFNIKYQNYSNSDEKYNIDTPILGMILGLYYAGSLEGIGVIANLRYAGDFGKSMININKSTTTSFIIRRGITFTVGMEFTL